MTKRVGLWIDHKKAVIVSLGDKGETIQKIESGAKHLEYRGAQRSKVAYSAQYSQGDDQLDRQYLQHLKKYYAQVISHLRHARSVLVFGPGEAKTELKGLLGRQMAPARRITVETADRMTDRQIAARVRKHFERNASTG
jgi:hypothetical protein